MVSTCAHLRGWLSQSGLRPLKESRKDDPAPLDHSKRIVFLLPLLLHHQDKKYVYPYPESTRTRDHLLEVRDNRLSDSEAGAS